MVVLKRISIIFMTLVFVLASGGILMVHTFCTCDNTEIASLYAIPEHCNPHTRANHSVQEEAQSCNMANSCCLPTEAETSTHTHHDASTSNCESSDFVYLKIDSQYLTSEEHTVDALAFPVFVHLKALQYIAKDGAGPSIQHPEFTRPHSFLTGRDFVLSCQQQKIPHNA